MDKFIPKFNLYETLAMLIPGATIIYAVFVFIHLIPQCARDCLMPIAIDLSAGEFFQHKTICIVLFIILSYLIGILHHSWMNSVFRCLRNDPTELLAVLKEMQEKNMYKKCLPQLLGADITSLTKDVIIEKYYEAYYYVFSKNKHISVPTIESQIHAIRNMFFPLMFVLIFNLIKYIIELCKNYHCECCNIMRIIVILIITCFIAFVFFYALNWLMHERQGKVYHAVFEDYEYLKRLES